MHNYDYIWQILFGDSSIVSASVFIMKVTNVANETKTITWKEIALAKAQSRTGQDRKGLASTSTATIK